MIINTMKINLKNVRIHNRSQSVIKPYFSLIPLNSLTQLSAIRNNDFPACKNCIHYRPRLFSNDFTSTLNKCDQFGEKNIISDEITYDYADMCRSEESKCGKEGREFKKEPLIILKRFKHAVFRPVTIFCSLSVVYLVSYYIKFLL
jgi:hypothetical protein